MSNVSLGQYLNDSPKLNNEKPVNEVLLTLIAASVLAYTCQPLLNTDFMKSIGSGIGMMFGGIGSMFGFGRNKDDKDSEKDYRNSEKYYRNSEKDDEGDGNTSKLDKDSETKNANDMMQNMFAFCQKHIDKEKDENKKKSLTGMLDVYRAASVDDDGNPVPLDKMAERFEQVTGQKPEDWAKENGIETPSKEEIEKINKAANDEIGKLSPEERKKVADEGRTMAKSTCDEIKKNRKEIEAEQKELDELKQKAEASKDPKEQKLLWNQVKEKSNNLTDKMKGVAGGIFGSKAISAAQETAEQASNNAEKSGDNSNNDSGGRDNDIEKAKKSSEDADAKSKQADTEKESKKAEDAEKETKTYELTHDGKPDKLIKRKKLKGEGHVWCWASDKKTTVAPDQAREMLKKANIKEGLSLSDWLKFNL